MSITNYYGHLATTNCKIIFPNEDHCKKLIFRLSTGDTIIDGFKGKKYIELESNGQITFDLVSNKISEYLAGNSKAIKQDIVGDNENLFCRRVSQDMMMMMMMMMICPSYMASCGTGTAVRRT